MQDTEAVLSELAEALTGRPVRVVFADPGRPDATALTYRTRGGFVVCLRPGLSARDTFRAFAHEAGHIMADARAFAVVDAAPRPNEVATDPGMEARADAIGDALMRLVPRHSETVQDMAAVLLVKLTERRNRR